MKNKKTLYHFVLDMSGSMSNCIEETLNGFNTQLDVIKALQLEYTDQEIQVSLTLFNDKIDTILSEVGIDEIKRITRSVYNPGGTTALLDAIGLSVEGIQKLNQILVSQYEMSVVMIILTDGYENTSRKFTFLKIAEMIKNLENTGQWTFTFLGADIDAMHTSKMINIKDVNVRSFNKEDFHIVMDEISLGMRDYISIKDKGITKRDFLDFEKDADSKT